MTRFRPAWVLLLAAALLALGLLAPAGAQTQKQKKARPAVDPDMLLKPQPRPKRPDLPPPLMTYKDAKYVAASNIPVRKIVMYTVDATISGTGTAPLRADTRVDRKSVV